MPPTAIEIKARLDKAVDQEGNVLDMEAVLEIVASLEKIVMTKESLEATRIGKTINLMRKRTSNEDLSKRAKKLVKRWQTVVSNHLKKTKKTDNLNGVVKQPGSLNGSKVETLPCATESELKLGVKRKRVSPDILKSTIAKTGLSPRLVSSPRPGSSPRVLSAPPKPGVSPRLVGIALKEELPSSPSPNVRSKLDYSKSKLSGLVGGEIGNEGSYCALNSSLTCALATEELATELNCSDFLNHTTHQNNNEQSSAYKEKHSMKNPLEKCCNDGSNNNSVSTDATTTNSTDTRVQEDRIVLSDYISTAATNGTNNSFTMQETKKIDNCEINISTINSTTDPVPTGFPPIDPEDLEVIRKELPVDLLSPLQEADGVNGIYNARSEWCPWEECVQQRESELLLLPYVILD